MMYIRKQKLPFTTQTIFIIPTVLLLIIILFLSFRKSKPSYKTPQTPTSQITSKPSLVAISPEVKAAVRVFQEEYDSWLLKGTQEEPLKFAKIQIYDLRSEDKYLAGHLKNSSIATEDALLYLAENNRFSNKIIIIITDLQETDSLRNLIAQIKRHNVEEVYLLSNFNPNDYPEDMINEVDIDQLDIKQLQ